jgi:hypothetical protein
MDALGRGNCGLIHNRLAQYLVSAGSIWSSKSEFIWETSKVSGSELMKSEKVKPEQEAAAPMSEEYEGSLIDHICLRGSRNHPDSIDLYLKNGDYIRIISVIETCPRSIASNLNVHRGGWLRGPSLSDR